MPSTIPAFLARIRLRAERRVLWMRRLWGSAADTRALAISDDDVDQILADRDEQSTAEDAFHRRETRELSERIEGADLIAADDPALTLLRDAFGLSAAELDFLSMCIAVEADPMLRRVFGYLHDDATIGNPTPGLGSSLFRWPVPPDLGPSSPLIRWRLAKPLDGFAPWSAGTPWCADAFATSLVLHGRFDDPGVPAAMVDTGSAAKELVLYPGALEAAETFLRAMQGSQAGSGTAVEIELIGPRGSGRRTLAAQLCARLGARLVVADAGPMQGDGLLRVLRLARAANAVVYWTAIGEARTWAALDATPDLMLFGAEAPLPRTRQSAARKTIVLPALAAETRRALWSRLADVPMPQEAAEWLVSPSELVTIAAVAPAGEAEMASTCRRLVQHAPGELFTPLACPYTWDDIVLPAALREHLREIEDRARLRPAVLGEWGLDRIHPLSRGLSALFAGPSGTGKTMAAQVRARALGTELYRVDLAGVVNKYVGETEKRLKLVFDACERSNILLFFDEADALFGQRTQVKDAHDRFANIEIDYLLQRMEQFEGIVVLATNRRSDLDKAFLRRLRFIVEFTQPGPGERLALWRRALPERTPAGEPLLDAVDFDALAAELAISGADIKAAALAAAFLARAEGSRIGMRLFVHATRREMAKQGVTLRSALGGVS
jgi:AAA+ superfamily predicted ATPase